MSLLEALLLGIIQGATEFLPISSSGHLVLSQYWLGIQEPQLLFDIILHVGTLLAVVAFYRRDVANVVVGLKNGLRDGLRERSTDALLAPEGARLALLVVLATIPTGLMGLGIDDLMEAGYSKTTMATFVSGALIINGAILYSGRFLRIFNEDEDRGGIATLWNITPLIAISLGIAQGMAVTPGLSRSGLTITAALALGVWRTEAARFSFLMSIPAILGALVLKFDPSAFAGPELSGTITVFGLGAITAGIVGYFCILLLVKLIKKAQFHHFAWYCWALGAAGLSWFLI